MKTPKVASNAIQLNYKEIKKLYKHLKKQKKLNVIDDTARITIIFIPTGIGTSISATYKVGDDSTESINITDHTSW